MEESVSGSILASQIKYLKDVKLFDGVYQRASPELRQLMDKPPTVLAFVSGQYSTELIEIVFGLKGADFVREMSHRSSGEAMGPVILPVMKSMLKIFGATPHTVFSQLHRWLGKSVTGVSCEYITLSPTSGQLNVSHLTPKTPIAYLSWEGSMRFAFELTGVVGTVFPADISVDRKSARIKVSWVPKK
jgi:hypothetical protein